MGIPFILNRRYTDDGCCLFSCLSCKADWETRSGGFCYCPYCGIQFKGNMINQRALRDNAQRRRMSRREYKPRPQQEAGTQSHNRSDSSGRRRQPSRVRSLCLGFWY